MKVEPRTGVEIDVVEENLIVGRNSTIKAKTGETIIVKGDIMFEGGCNVLSSLNAKNIMGRGSIHVKGDLIVEKMVDLKGGEIIVEGTLEAENIDVDIEIVVHKSLKSRKIDVGGLLKVGENLEAEDVDVGGTVTVHGNLKGRILDVGGALRVDGSTELEKLDVGGTAKVGGGKILEIGVGGVFESTGGLMFEKMSVGGVARLKRHRHQFFMPI